MPVVNDIIALMEYIAPCHLAEEWDNSGLQCGSRDWPVKNIIISLDPTLFVVEAACDKKADLLITHHPLIFHPLKNVVLDTPVGKILDLCIRHKLTIFSAHTNLDSVKGGLNDIFAEKIGLKNINILSYSLNPTEGQMEGQDGMGRIGKMENPLTLASLSDKVKAKLKLKTVKVSGALDMEVKKVAVCTGSGSGLMKDFFASDADVYISGDLKYHDAKDSEIRSRGLIDVGHFASEELMIDMLKERLMTLIKEKGFDIRIEAFHQEADPFNYI